jgi:hypothetical protein
MTSDERYVTPYLLRPLRTLDEVLGGRGRAVERACGGAETTPTGHKGARSRTALQNDQPSSSASATEQSWRAGYQ